MSKFKPYKGNIIAQETVKTYVTTVFQVVEIDGDGKHYGYEVQVYENDIFECGRCYWYKKTALNNMKNWADALRD